MAVILIDFDGTCVPSLPEGGWSSVDTGSERVLKKLISKGHSLVLWTARNSSPENPWNYVNGKLRKESSLEEAVRWFREREIQLAGINEVPGEIKLIGTSRKALGDYLIDDTACGTPLVWDDISYHSYEDSSKEKFTRTFFVDWKKMEIILKNLKLL